MLNKDFIEGFNFAQETVQKLADSYSVEFTLDAVIDKLHEAIINKLAEELKNHDGTDVFGTN